ncbi:MAG: RDD family protein [Thermoanaerobaculia bacterium]
MLCRNHVDVAEGVRRCARCGAPFCSDCLVELSGRPYCATCKSEQLLDVRSGVDRSQLQYAPILSRFGAIFLDGLLIAIPAYAIMGVVVFLPAMRGQQPNPLLANSISLPFTFISLLYEALMLAHRNGQTLGKMALKVRVVRPDGSPISSGQAWGRVIMRTILGCMVIVDYIPAFFTPEKTTLHDMIAGTRVVQV